MCNVDASFSSSLNKVGIGICIRGECGVFILEKYDHHAPICDVCIGAALGLPSAIMWMHKLNLGLVEFELDSKIVMDNFHSNKFDTTGFGEIIIHSKRLFSYYFNSSVEFIRRQANEISHSLAKTATYIANP
jgi:hypothetical protein